MKNRVVILDFGSQYTKLIARRVRELKVFSQIVPYNIDPLELKSLEPAALVFSGGPSSVYDSNAPRVAPEILGMGIPVLGICYGLQLIAFLLKMKVEPAREREYGLARLDVLEGNGLLSGVADRSKVWMSHGDKLSQFPEDFRVTGRTENTEIAVIESQNRRLYGVQFHPEVYHTDQGKQVLANFLFKQAGLQADWNMGDFIDTAIAEIRETVGAEKVILGLSGGVDSTVLALLLQKALGRQSKPVFVNTGLLRKDEYSTLMETFKRDLDLDVTGVDASELFLKNLEGVADPEGKRKIIGRTFIDVFSQTGKEMGDVNFLAQGTLYPDVIESISVNGPSAKIKSHHNVGGLPDQMNWKLIEPFRELFKDEVREVGRQLDLDERFVMRHPFPGPGLAVRILGGVSADKVEKLQQADAILIEELHRSGLYDETWQAFVVLLPIRSVGVMGDERTYENVAVLRMVESVDGMTADWFPAPPQFLNKVANRIVNEVKGINRVTYDLTSKPPGTIEWE